MPSDRDPSWRLRGFARVMRHEPTDAERRLWAHLRDRKMGGFKFRRQVPIAGFVVDFYCIETKLGVELDGGRHCDPEEIRYDEIRSAKLNEIGIRVLRFSDVDALRDTPIVLAEIYSVLSEDEPWPPLT
jgi:very-short-patch-repair endonuclease